MPAQTLYKHTTARYGRMIVFANDTGAVTSSLLHYGEWAEQEIAFMTALIGVGATVVDVGAYIGTHTLAFSRKVGASGRVIAFEPQPASFRVLERNVAMNDLANVELHETAVGDHAGKTSFQPTDSTAASSFGSAALTERSDALHSPDEPRVMITRIDDLNLTRCDLIKIDANGMERAVLEGSTRFINEYRPWFYVECNSVERGLETRQFLHAHGYEVRLHLSSAFNPDNFRRESTNIFDHAREAALVGIPPGSATKISGLFSLGGPLIAIQTADDLVLGMLNKPQYVGEILQGGAAAQTGGAAWIDDYTAPKAHLMEEDIRFAAQLEQTQAAQEESRHLSAQLARTQQALEETQTLAIERLAQTQEAQEALEETQTLAIERYDANKRLEAMLEATLAQADIARSMHRREVGEITASTRVDFARLREKEAELDRQIAADRTVQAQLAALLTSTSWRITRPMRVIVRLLQRR